MKYNVVLIKFGEIGVKGAFARRRMQSALARNIEQALIDSGFSEAKVRVLPGRIIVEGITEEGKEAFVISRVFGVTGVSRAYMGYYSNLDDLVQKAADEVEGDVKGKVFMVRGRRAEEERFTSKDLERALGAELLKRGALKVNLENPEIKVWVEARAGRFFIYTEEVTGPGGLPLGTEGKLVALVSGGFDSPVAAWMLMKRGARVDIAFFNIGGKEQKEKFIDTVRALVCNWCYGYSPKIFVVEHRWIFPYLERFPEGFRTVALKASLYIGAEAIAQREGAKAIATGESLAQVSSQTLDNLYATEQFVKIPILRPLIGMDKEEIIDISRKIGTYEPSSKMPEFCAIAGHRASISVEASRLKDIFSKVLPVDEIKSQVLSNVITLTKEELCRRGP
ncbi:MAG: tRNA 4-thiouridine(8) synthase ThiI [Thermoprotei archaeon]|nr:tRNA 4-thiouridine(8) synthase ThiI [Thermoprotei archaeon]